MDAYPEWKGRNGLSKMKIKKIADARAAIKMHSETGYAEAMRYDLQNGPYHAFGDHRKCSVACYKAKQAAVQEMSKHSSPKRELDMWIDHS